MVGGEILTLRLYTQNAQNFVGNQTCMQNMKVFFEPLTFPPPQPFKSGCWDRTPKGANFFRKPHMHMFKMISATRGSFLGTCVEVLGTPPPNWAEMVAEGFCKDGF